ncbi:hypothetical protein XA68_11817 [Ophiocordyceps unilateralis]|uniref:Copper transport protein n=1 Tax=Ophiocordyceps unilateralis TaxID=268505 RepID=A0A2A9PMT0_OPHUN|nr:hypothetical protein XA68_11817 [Ophiocordyceps unilateralis]
MDRLAALVKRHGGMDHHDGGMDHGGHDHSSMGHGGGSSCKFSMVFHSTTIDSCFLSDKWHITSTAMFAGSCIGVFLLAVTLELIRRLVKEYDRHLLRQHLAHFPPMAEHNKTVSERNKEAATSATAVSPSSFRPTVYQQAARAFLQLMLITCAWTLMLLVMYFNVYLILSILLGFYVGAFVFQWEKMPINSRPTASDSALCCS